RIVADRLPDGGTGVIEPPGWIRWGGAPTFTLEEQGRRTADFWLTAPATVRVHVAGTSSAPAAAAVEPGWDDNAIRLTLRCPDDVVLRTDTFARAATGGGLPRLSRAAETVLEVRGTYRASIRDAAGAEAGWIRVKISPYQESARTIDGVL